MSNPVLYLDDLRIGQKFISSEHVLDAAQIIEYARQFDPQVFHTDPEKARDTFFQGLAASGWHTASITMKLVVESLPMSAGVIGAGVEELSWPQPTRPDDVLHVESEILEIIPSRSKPGRAIVRIRCETKNQRGEVVQSFVPKLLAFKRP
ncbi:MaoC family dehydratase [Diaphorobacter ruginosibacter]|jgi:acyl dehydratase|uniref:MaoC family dehydratase n=1 Tax=Diaphorobacter ruginosibacter TaxID=1715720 RepID=A0A7G9RL72_9BURK|nr:MaoC family dehydratase [Diaphorobacter ruginosibacter]MDR2336084.1 MaoC family dehydratase [Burkholderiaceae bacterium]QNN56347.1 MaoC family dehydratase [Diaphorobacter ruginosibacter]